MRRTWRRILAALGRFYLHGAGSGHSGRYRFSFLRLLPGDYRKGRQDMTPKDEPRGSEHENEQHDHHCLYENRWEEMFTMLGGWRLGLAVCGIVLTALLWGISNRISDVKADVLEERTQRTQEMREQRQEYVAGQAQILDNQKEIMSKLASVDANQRVVMKKLELR